MKIGVRWSREKGYLELRNPLTGETCEILAKGAPKWLFDRLNEQTGRHYKPPAVRDSEPLVLPQAFMGGACLQCGSDEGFDSSSELCRQCAAAEPWSAE
jgi:hypothetical protein